MVFMVTKLMVFMLTKVIHYLIGLGLTPFGVSCRVNLNPIKYCIKSCPG